MIEAVVVAVDGEGCTAHEVSVLLPPICDVVRAPPGLEAEQPLKAASNGMLELVGLLLVLSQLLGGAERGQTLQQPL